jgi:hypothetical protein
MRILALLALLTACKPGDGERCNPSAFTDECQPNDRHLACVLPTGPNCGVAFCCAVDATGKIVDENSNCKPDPASAASCGIDLGSD